MIAATWRLARISAIETSFAELQMLRQKSHLERQFEFIDAHTRQTLALFEDMDRATLTLNLQRYQATAGRAYSRALRLLKELQGDRFGRRPDTPPVAPTQTEAPVQAPSQTGEAPEPSAAPEHAAPEPAPASSWAPKVIILKLRNSENSRLQTEPGAIPHPPLTMCA
jgi:hypothetical protein